MRRFAVGVLLLAIPPSPALAQGILLFADNQGLSCEVADVLEGVKRIYVFHMYSNGSTASEFRVDASATTFGFISSTVPATMLNVGSADTGISIAYNECKFGSFLICTCLYDNFGTTPPCTRVTVEEDLNAVPPVKIYVDCSGFVHPIAGGLPVVVNANATCPCSPDPIQPSTWGTIKALYK